MDVVAQMKKLNLPAGQYAVCGSGVMAIRGIRAAHDIDLVVTEALYNELKSRGWNERFWPTKRPKEVFLDPYDAGTTWSVNTYDPDPLRLIAEADHIDGIAFVKFAELVAWKQAAGRPKDLADLKLIAAYERTSPSGII